MTKLDIITKARRALKISKKRKEDHVLLLRTCDEKLQAYGGFQWPGVGNLVEAPDWSPYLVCGYGLHGALWGVGDGSLLAFGTSKWLVVAARSDSVVDLVGKVKVPKAFVCFVGSQLEATNWLVDNSHVDMTTKPVIGLNRTVSHKESVIVGYCGNAIAGDRGRATAGSNGSATAGSNGSATAGFSGKAVAGYHGKAVAGKQGTATVGDYGHAIAGFNGKAIAGNYGTAVAGFEGEATVGNYGKSEAGNYGTAVAGYSGTAAAGEKGIIRVSWYDSRYRWATGYVGEDGIEPNVAYKATIDGKLVKCTK